MNHVKSVLLLIGGLVLMILGLGIWRSPSIDWHGFIDTFGMLAKDGARLFKEPFAALGAIVLIIGLWMIVSGVRRFPQG